VNFEFLSRCSNAISTIEFEGCYFGKPGLHLVVELAKVDSMRWWTKGRENERIECRKELRQIN
jgi:hypothetical protein